MGNYTDNQHLCVFIIDKNEINETTLVQMFDLDSDFSENQEYFRKKTIKANMTESQMCAKEVYNKCKHITSPFEKLTAMVGMLIGYSNGEQTFIVGNSTYCGNHNHQLNEVGDKIVVSIAYISS